MPPAAPPSEAAAHGILCQIHPVAVFGVVLKEGVGPVSYTHLAKGKEAALNLIGQGCDIVFTNAAKTGLGVIEAGKELSLIHI